MQLTARFLLARARPLWPLLLSLAVFLASLAAALRTALRWTDGRLIYALDDAYIHMAVAKTLASHGIWGCTPFHFSSSSSSQTSTHSGSRRSHSAVNSSGLRSRSRAR